jgi:PKD repeat protein
MAHMTKMTRRFKHLAALVLATLAPACTVTDTQPPPLAGPSEMSLSLTITANPDVLSLDGASQSQIMIEARDANGQPAANVPLRVEIVADGTPVDFGTISARTLVTGSNGRATLTYTAPGFVEGTIPNLQLSVTPTGTDAASHLRRNISIRLVPPGVIGIAPTARFTFTPEAPAAFTDVRFDGTTSTPGIGATIVKYTWDFGDNTSASTGSVASHKYSAPGTFLARLTVTDNNGLSGQSATQAIVVGAGVAPTAEFVFSPTSPAAGQSVFFNGATSTAGAGHQIVQYDWDFGTGSKRSGVTVSKTYDTPGTFNVVLTVTDEAGQTGQRTRDVIVGNAAVPVASFTFSPTDPAVGTSVNFNGSGSTAPSGSRITSYTWDFGDGSTGTGVRPSHPYGAAHTYTVRLTVRDSEGRTATATQLVPVE